MTITKHIGLAVATFVLAACQSNILNITGEVHHIGDGATLYLSYLDDGDNHPFDSVIVKNSRFIFNSQVDSIRLCCLYNHDVQVFFFTEPGNVYIEIFDCKGQSRVSGTKINNQWQALNDTVSKYDQHLRSLMKNNANGFRHRALYHKINGVYDILIQRIEESSIRREGHL